MRHPKPYRLYQRETGYYFYKLPGGRKGHRGACVRQRRAAMQDRRYSTAARAVNGAFERYIQGTRTAAGGKGRQLSDSYVDSTRSYLNGFLPEDPLGQLPLSKITADDFQDFQTRLLEKLADKRTTAVRALEAVRLVLRRAEKLGQIPRDPDRALDVRGLQPAGRASKASFASTKTSRALNSLF